MSPLKKVFLLLLTILVIVAIIFWARRADSMGHPVSTVRISQ